MRAGLVLGPGGRRRGVGPGPSGRPMAVAARAVAVAAGLDGGGGGTARRGVGGTGEVVGARHGCATPPERARRRGGDRDRPRWRGQCTRAPSAASGRHRPGSVRPATSGRPPAGARLLRVKLHLRIALTADFGADLQCPRHRGPEGPRGGSATDVVPVALCLGGDSPTSWASSGGAGRRAIGSSPRVSPGPCPTGVDRSRLRTRPPDPSPTRSGRADRARRPGATRRARQGRGHEGLGPGQRVEQRRRPGQEGGGGRRQGAPRAVVVGRRRPGVRRGRGARPSSEHDVGGVVAGEMAALHDHRPTARCSARRRAAALHALDVVDGMRR